MHVLDKGLCLVFCNSSPAAVETLNIISCFKDLTVYSAARFISQLSRVIPSRELTFNLVAPHISMNLRQVLESNRSTAFGPKLSSNNIKVRLFSDREFFGNDLYDQIYKYEAIYTSVHNHSFGWIVQQLIKMYAPFKFSSNVLIFDSDSLPLSFSESFCISCCIPFLPENNNAYRGFKELLCYDNSVLPDFVGMQTAHIAQHMYFKLDYMKSFCAHLNRLFGLSLVDSGPEEMLLHILHQSSVSPYYRFSEYEIYAVYVTHILRAPVSLKPIKLARHAKIAIKYLPFRAVCALYSFLHCDIIAVEAWTKPHHIFELIKLLAFQVKGPSPSR